MNPDITSIQEPEIVSKSTGGPAFPHDGQADYTGGMTLRDYFAAQALQGICAKYNIREPGDQIVIAKMSYELADSMIAERGKV